MTLARERAPLGATARGTYTEFRVWAPFARHVDVLLVNDRRRVALAAEGDGVFGARVDVEAGADYFYRVDGLVRPDPRSRYQPSGVHGPSRVVDPTAFAWTDGGWTGVPRESLVFYELHVGTFTPEGAFDGVIPKLRYLADLGVTAIEFMPIAEFPGARNWGYDGVCPFAPHSAYGGPDGFRRLVDACHRAGLAVFVDTVLNHLGPEGNYLGDYAPYFTTRYRTPWGPAFDFEAAEVRRYVIDAARSWIDEFHIDGLRLDAVHTMHDASEQHVASELARSCREIGEKAGRRTWIVAECDLNDPKIVRSEVEGGWGLDAQWSDDFHHALYAVVTGKNPAHLADFGAIAELAKALADGMVFDGRYSPRRKRYHGAPTTGVDGERFVVFAQNHDQVANVSAGRRLAELVSVDAQKAVAMILCVAPYLVLLFQGQEYGERRRFHYFTSHSDPDLVEHVRRARRAEYAGVVERHGLRFEDPQDAATFEHSKLDWQAATADEPDGLRRLYRTLLDLRKRVRCLGNCRRDLTHVAFDETARWLRVERSDPDGSAAVLAVNLSSSKNLVPMPRGAESYRTRISSQAEPPSPDPSSADHAESGLLLGPLEAVLLLDAEPSGPSELYAARDAPTAVL